MATLPDLRDQVRAAMGEGDLRRALFLAKLIQLRFPQDNEALAQVGQGYAGVGRLLEARRLFERVLEVDPENGSARWDLASILEKQGESEAALEQMERAWEGGLSDYRLMEDIRRLHSQFSPGWPLDVGSSATPAPMACWPRASTAMPSSSLGRPCASPPTQKLWSAWPSHSGMAAGCETPKWRP